MKRKELFYSGMAGGMMCVAFYKAFKWMGHWFYMTTNCVFNSIINHLTFLFSFPSFFFSYVASFLASFISFNPVTSSVNFFSFSYYEAKTHKELDRGLTNSLILKG